MNWRQVSAQLRTVGVEQPGGAIRCCKDQGCDAGHALALIAYGRDGGWGPQAIAHRLKIARPSLKVFDGWPKLPQPAPPGSESETRRRQAEINDALAGAIIRTARKAQKPDAEIRAELAAAGLEWPK